MYLDELRATGRRTLAITCGVALTASLIAASSEGWRMFPRLFRDNLTIAAFIGSLFWFCAPLIRAYSERLSPLWQWAFRIVAWTVGLNVGILCGMAALATMGVLPWEHYLPQFREAFLPGVLINTICFTAFTIHEGQKYRMQYEVAQARLTSLEARLRPHFLFNALNSIAALIPEDPASAERVTVKLADLLRYSLDSEHRNTVPLERELKMLTDCLEIERTRFGANLCYSVDVAPELLPMQVPPFCLQTLVENSVKYGGGEIRIHAHNGNGKSVLTVWDSGVGFEGRQKEIPGHGLHDLRKRLAVLWGSEAALAYPPGTGGTAVEISIPCRVCE